MGSKQKDLKERYLIQQDRAQHANFQGNPLFASHKTTIKQQLNGENLDVEFKFKILLSSVAITTIKRKVFFAHTSSAALINVN